MNIILWIILGGAAGWLASIIVGKNARMGALSNIVVGIIGAFLGGWIADLLGFSYSMGFNFASLLIAVGGAVVLLVLINLVFGSIRKARR